MNSFSAKSVGVGLLVLVANWCGLTALGQVNGSEEKTPPASFQGPASIDNKPNGLTALQLRVAWTPLESGDVRLTVQASGPPATAFLLGAVRPGVSRPVVVTPANLDAEGRWTLVRDVPATQARALTAVDFVAITR